MKRIMFVILCAATIVVVAGCEKMGKSNLDDRLVGTKWQTSDYARKLIYGGNPNMVYEFISTTELECYTTNAGSVVLSRGTYTYSLNYPHITINEISSGETTPSHFTFKDSRTMCRDGVSESTPYATFIKQ